LYVHTPNDASLERDKVKIEAREGMNKPEWKISRAATRDERAVSFVRRSAEVNDEIRAGQECCVYALSRIQRRVMNYLLFRQ
jgi:hypothetical protein